MNGFWIQMVLGLKVLIFSIFILISMAFLLANAKAALAANLKDMSVVTDNTLKLGDLFEGLHQNADYVLGPAPQPGQDMVLNAKTLYRIAVALELPWRPESSAQQIVVRRAASVVPFERVEERLMDAVIEEGVESNFELKLFSQKEDIVLPHGNSETAELQSFSFNPQTDTFEAVVVAPSTANPITQIPVSGKIERMIQIPVIRSALRNGDIIGETDIDWIVIPEKKIQRDLVMKSDTLVGMTPRRSLLAGKPVLEGDLERPQIVTRGEIVTVIYKDGPMRLSAKGKALQNGAKGDAIRISNVNSNRTLQGFVTNTKEVTVQ